MEQVPVFKPLITQDEIDAATESLKMGWLGMGSYVSRFEEELTQYLGLKDKYLACVNTGHSALHLALVVAGVKAGDEVITPSFNSVSDHQAIFTVGAENVLCDVLDETLCIDMDSAEELVTDKTKAVIIMDYGNSLCDYKRVEAFSKKYPHIRIIHDACHAMGSVYEGKKIGSFSDITMLSFDPVKTMTALDGGAIIVSSEKELHEIHELRILGMGQPPSVMYQNKRAWTFHVDKLGFRYHLLNMHGAIGLSQLAKMDFITKTRRESCRYYIEHLSEVSGIRTPDIDLENITPFIFYIRVLDGHRNDLRKFLETQGVDSGIHWQAGHRFEFLKDARRGDMSVTEKADQEILTLPLHSDMSHESQDRVIAGIKKYFSEKL